MVASCSAYGCPNRKSTKKPLSFHRFPQDPILRQKWILATGRNNFIPGNHTCICSEHFLPEDFYPKFVSGLKKLRENTVPSLFKYKEPTKISLIKPKVISNSIVEHDDSGVCVSKNAPSEKSSLESPVTPMTNSRPEKRPRKTPVFASTYQTQISPAPEKRPRLTPGPEPKKEYDEEKGNIYKYNDCEDFNNEEMVVVLVPKNGNNSANNGDDEEIFLNIDEAFDFEKSSELTKKVGHEEKTELTGLKEHSDQEKVENNVKVVHNKPYRGRKILKELSDDEQIENDSLFVESAVDSTEVVHKRPARCKVLKELSDEETAIENESLFGESSPSTELIHKKPARHKVLKQFSDEEQVVNDSFFSESAVSTELIHKKPTRRKILKEFSDDETTIENDVLFVVDRNFCRLCLSKCPDMLPLFETNLRFFESSLEFIIDICTGIQVIREDASDRICRTCLSRLESFWAFREQCLKSDKLVKKMKNIHQTAEVIVPDILDLGVVDQNRGKDANFCNNESLTPQPITNNNNSPTVKRFLCSSCGQKFGNENLLTVHVKNEHEDLFPFRQRALLTLTCSICSQWVRKNMLHDHYLLHKLLSRKNECKKLEERGIEGAGCKEKGEGGDVEDEQEEGEKVKVGEGGGGGGECKEKGERGNVDDEEKQGEKVKVGEGGGGECKEKGERGNVDDEEKQGEKVKVGEGGGGECKEKGERGNVDDEEKQGEKVKVGEGGGGECKEKGERGNVDDEEKQGEKVKVGEGGGGECKEKGERGNVEDEEEEKEKRKVGRDGCKETRGENVEDKERQGEKVKEKEGCKENVENEEKLEEKVGGECRGNGEGGNVEDKEKEGDKVKEREGCKGKGGGIRRERDRAIGREEGKLIEGRKKEGVDEEKGGKINENQRGEIGEGRGGDEKQGGGTGKDGEREEKLGRVGLNGEKGGGDKEGEGGVGKVRGDEEKSGKGREKQGREGGKVKERQESAKEKGEGRKGGGEDEKGKEVGEKAKQGGGLVGKGGRRGKEKGDGGREQEVRIEEQRVELSCVDFVDSGMMDRGGNFIEFPNRGDSEYNLDVSSIRELNRGVSNVDKSIFIKRVRESDINVKRLLQKRDIIVRKGNAVVFKDNMSIIKHKYNQRTDKNLAKSVSRLDNQMSKTDINNPKVSSIRVDDDKSDFEGYHAFLVGEIVNSQEIASFGDDQVPENRTLQQMMDRNRSLNVIGDDSFSDQDVVHQIANEHLYQTHEN